MPYSYLMAHFLFNITLLISEGLIKKLSGLHVAVVCSHLLFSEASFSFLAPLLLAFLGRVLAL